MFLLAGIFYVIFVGAVSQTLPPVDYKAISEEQTRQMIPETKSPNQIPVPAQDPQVKL